MLKRLRESFRGRTINEEPAGTRSAVPEIASDFSRRHHSEGAAANYQVGNDRNTTVSITTQVALQSSSVRMSAAARQRIIARRISGSNFLPAPKTAIAANNGAAHGLVWGEACMQGWRSHMEDAYIAKVSIESMPGWCLFSILDGHAGKYVAEVSAQVLPHAVEAYVSPVRHSPRGLMDGVRRSFLRHDIELKRMMDQAPLKDISGATCTAALIGPSQIVLVNIGDSRIVVCRGGRPIVCTIDHKPTDQKETMRIQNAGGRVLNARVDGGLALSRAFGDFEYKTRNDLLQTQQKVTAEPDSIYIRRSYGLDDFIILACDGLWDVISNEHACDFVYTHMRERMPPSEISKQLVKAALVRGSRDNISVMVVVFDKSFTPKQSHEEIIDGIGKSAARFALRQGVGLVLTTPILRKALELKSKQSRSPPEGPNPGPAVPATNSTKANIVKLQRNTPDDSQVSEA